MGLALGGCSEESNEEYFNRTAPPGVSGPIREYSSVGGQQPPGGSADDAAPKGEAPPAPEAPAPPEAPVPDDTTKG
jgi:hypothetical protein